MLDFVSSVVVLLNVVWTPCVDVVVFMAILGWIVEEVVVAGYVFDGSVAVR